MKFKYLAIEISDSSSQLIDEHERKTSVKKKKNQYFAGGPLQEKVFESPVVEEDLNQNTKDKAAFQEAGM